MHKRPLIGAAMMIDDIANHLPFLKERNRDIEIQDFIKAELLDGDRLDAADRALAALGEYHGAIGIHGPFLGLPIASPDPDIRAVVNKRMHQALDAAERLKAAYMVIHSPYTTWDYNNFPVKPENVQNICNFTHDTLANVVTRAEMIGLTLVIENIEDKDPFARVRLAESFDSPAVAVSIDTGHAHYAHGSTGAPPVDYYVQAAGKFLKHVHLQDADGYADRHWQIGHGTICWHSVFAALGQLETQPHLMLELRHAARIEASLAYLQAEGLVE
jgi:sugar phosphate isomerase/epimerase